MWFVLYFCIAHTYFAQAGDQSDSWYFTTSTVNMGSIEQLTVRAGWVVDAIQTDGLKVGGPNGHSYTVVAPGTGPVHVTKITWRSNGYSMDDLIFWGVDGNGNAWQSAGLEEWNGKEKGYGVAKINSMEWVHGGPMWAAEQNKGAPQKFSDFEIKATDGHYIESINVTVSNHHENNNLTVLSGFDINAEAAIPGMQYEKYCSVVAKPKCSQCEKCDRTCKTLKGKFRWAQRTICLASCSETQGQCYKDKSCACLSKSSWAPYCSGNTKKKMSLCVTKCKDNGTTAQKPCQNKCRTCMKKGCKNAKGRLDNLLCRHSCADSGGECEKEKSCACVPK